MNEILSAVQDLVNAVQNRDIDDSFQETDESGYFVSRIDQVKAKMKCVGVIRKPVFGVSNQV